MSNIKNLVTTPFIEEEPPKYAYITTHDPFASEFCGRLDITDMVLNSMKSDLTYQIHIKPYFNIKKVIFNNPATIVYWEDGTKTVVKCGKDDTFDAEKGLALCFMKKALGNKGNFNNTIKEYVK